MQQFYAIKERMNEDREGELKITFTIPQSDKHKALDIPVQTNLIVTVLTEEEAKENVNAQ